MLAYYFLISSYTKPVNVKFMQLTSGQRYSALLKTKNHRELSSDGKYFMQVESRERPSMATSYAVLQYSHSGGSSSPLQQVYPPARPLLTLPPTDQSFLEYTLEPLQDNDFPTLDQVTRRVYIQTQQVVLDGGNGQASYIMNNVSWNSSFPQEPYLVSLYKDDGVEFPSIQRALEHGGVDPIVRSWPAQIGEVLEVVLVNQAQDINKSSVTFDTHPFHAHGMHFYDIGSGNGSYDITENEKRLQNYRPIKRDTTPLYRFQATGAPSTKLGWRAWRLRIDQPGVWMLHCHTLQHIVQ